MSQASAGERCFVISAPARGYGEGLAAMACFLSRRRRWRRRVAGVSRRRPRGSGRVGAAESAVRRWLHPRPRRARRPTASPRAPASTRGESNAARRRREIYFPRCVGQPYSLAIKPLSASEGGLWPPLPIVDFELLRAVTWGRKRAKRAAGGLCWLGLSLAGPTRLRRQRCNRLVVAWEYVSAAAGQNPACSERLSGE